MDNTVERIAEIDDEIDEMLATLEGCDWCCGGGDERMAALQADRAALVESLGFDPKAKSEAVAWPPPADEIPF